MKKTTVLILCLVFFSLACVTSAAIGATVPTATAGATFTKQKQAVTSSPQICARVIAIEALHLRKGPSENDIHLRYLKNGDVVQVIDQSNADWWRIEHDHVVGFARSIYLKESECE